MPDMNIRNVPPELIKAAKKAALDLDIHLYEYIFMLIEKDTGYTTQKSEMVVENPVREVEG